MELQPFQILYEDSHYVAINKPAGIHVHPTRLSRGERSCVVLLRRQLCRDVYTIHRLDRATSGVLIFALSSAAARGLSGAFARHEVRKRYLAVVRGYLPEESGEIDHPLREDKGKEAVAAVTRYRRLGIVELPYRSGRFPTSRFSLAEAFPLTGRQNQIRRHFAHISHPVVGDVNLGDGRQNRLFREHLNSHRLLLFADRLELIHPISGVYLTISAPLDHQSHMLLSQLGWLQNLN